MFSIGEIYKLTTRTDDHPLFVMVVADPDPDPDMFRAVVILDRGSSHRPGALHNNWFKRKFALVDWQEVKRWL